MIKRETLAILPNPNRKSKEMYCIPTAAKKCGSYTSFRRISVTVPVDTAAVTAAMGCGGSKVYVVNDRFPGQGPECLEVLQKLLLTGEEINIMYNAFSEFDIDGDGEISLLEFLTIMQIGPPLIP